MKFLKLIANFVFNVNYLCKLYLYDAFKIPRTKMEASINQFSWYLYREMAKEVTAADNVLFSPLSVYFALSIVFAGSRGKTADQIKSVLKILSDPESQDHNIRLKKVLTHLPYYLLFMFFASLSSSKTF